MDKLIAAKAADRNMAKEMKEKELQLKYAELNKNFALAWEKCQNEKVKIRNDQEYRMFKEKLKHKRRRLDFHTNQVYFPLKPLRFFQTQSKRLF